MSYCDHRPSIVRRPSTSLIIFSSKTFTSSNFAWSFWQSGWDRGDGPLTKMAAMPVYGKKKSWTPGLPSLFSDWSQEVTDRQYSFIAIDLEVFSTVILYPFFWFKKGICQFLVKKMCTILVNRIEDYACPIKIRLGKVTALEMTPMVWLGRKTSTQTQNQVCSDDYLRMIFTFKRQCQICVHAKNRMIF